MTRIGYGGAIHAPNAYKVPPAAPTPAFDTSDVLVVPAPRRRRRRTWTLAQIEAVRELRERSPRWSKTKIAVVLRRDMGLLVSASTVGRILTDLRRRGRLREPVGRRISARKRRPTRPHATRKPRDYRVERPGDLVELDTLDVRPPGVSHPDRQFTARDVVSRWDVLELRRNATARAAASVLEAILARMPFEVRAISVDGGSEFMAEFEAACAERMIRLFVLPPRSPKLNGAVERANRTHTEEFSEVTDAEPEFEALATALADWEICSQHRPAPLGPGLPHPARMARRQRLPAGRGGGTLPNPFSTLSTFRVFL